MVAVTISKKIDTFIFGERAFNTKCPKLGKVSPAKTLSNVTNSFISENPQFSRVSGCCELTRMILDSFSISIPRKTTVLKRAWCSRCSSRKQSKQRNKWAFFVSAAGGKEDPIVLTSQKSFDVLKP